jgi:hypothetical protein
MNAQDLVNKARGLAFMPNTSGFSDQDLLDEINIAQQIMLVPAIVRASGEYFTETADVPVDANGFARIPTAAVASTARMLSWLYDDGHEGPPLIQLSLADVFSQSSSEPYSDSGPVGGATFTFVPDGVQIYGTQTSGMVRVRYSRSPATLTLLVASPGSLWSVTGVTDNGTNWIAAVTPVYPVVYMPPGVPCDITDATSPHRMLFTGMSDGLGNVTCDLDSNPNRVAAGDFVTISGGTYVPQYADEWHVLLLYYGAARIADLRKDSARKQSLLTDAEGIRHELTNIAQPRSKINAKRINAWAGWPRSNY